VAGQQFEREVTGERIRDKFAASKKKGIWMGGNSRVVVGVRFLDFADLLPLCRMHLVRRFPITDQPVPLLRFENDADIGPGISDADKAFEILLWR
jgi:hypothetical protein